MYSQCKGLIIFGVVNLCFFCGCVGPAPLEDYNLAFVSLESAKSVQAPRFAPGYFNQAEESYRQALIAYEARHYKEARAKFLQAKQFAEKAENYTVLKKAEMGGGE